MNWRVLIPVMSVVVLLTSGCASLRFMNSKNKVPEACLATCGRLKIELTSFILTVNISKQTVSLFEDNKFVKKFRCSTSRFGIGQIEGSNRTPLGLHRASCGSKVWSRVSTRAATWIRTPATFTSMARATRRRLAVPRRSAAFIWPTRI